MSRLKLFIMLILVLPMLAMTKDNKKPPTDDCESVFTGKPMGFDRVAEFLEYADISSVLLINGQPKALGTVFLRMDFSSVKSGKFDIFFVKSNAQNPFPVIRDQLELAVRAENYKVLDKSVSIVMDRPLIEFFVENYLQEYPRLERLILNHAFSAYLRTKDSK